MKYRLTENKKVIESTILYQIQRISNGELGGWIEKEANLSQEGDCWIYDNAIVSGDAQVYDNAKVFRNARVYGNAQVYVSAKVYDNAIVSGDAQVYDNAKVSGDARVFGNAKVFEDAEVFGNAKVFEDAEVSGDCWIYDNAKVSGDCWIYDNAQVSGYAKVSGDCWIYDNAQVSGYAKVYDNAKVSKIIRIFYSYNCDDPSNLIAIIKGSLNIFPDKNGDYILYKRVNKIKNGYFSCFDPSFEYKIGKIVKVKNPDFSNRSCASGIHLSHPEYWSNGNALLQCQVNIEDIITCQEGKIRCSKCKVIREVI